MKKFAEAIRDYNNAIENDAGGSSQNADDIKYKSKFYKGIAL